MKRKSISFAIFVLWNVLSAAQDTPTIYAESFRKGSTQVTEESFEAKLTPQEPTYREVIKDSHGADRYDLTVTPERPEGGTGITSWRVQMSDMRHAIYTNVLLANQAPSQDAKNNLWWLTPNAFAPVPVRARRIIKVDSFYVVIQVKNLHFTPLDSPYLDTMTVQFAFSNRDPRDSK